jgi:hypothetical protein
MPVMYSIRIMLHSMQVTNSIRIMLHSICMRTVVCFNNPNIEGTYSFTLDDLRDRRPQAVLQEAENIDSGTGLTSNFDIVTHPTAPTDDGYQGSAGEEPSDGGGVERVGSGGGVGSSDGGFELVAADGCNDIPSSFAVTLTSVPSPSNLILAGGDLWDTYNFTRKWKLRDISQLSRECKVRDELLPIFGPFMSTDDAVNAIRTFYKCSFDVKKDTKRDGTGKAGPKRCISCSQTRDCPFYARYELGKQGNKYAWHLIAVEEKHSNHVMNRTATIGQLLSNPQNREIPENLMQFAELMYLSGTHPKTIFTSLQEYCKREGTQPMFLFDDVLNALVSKYGEKESFDSSNFLQLLMKRQEERGLFFDYSTREGNLDVVFTIMEAGLKYAHGGVTICVIFFDTTFKTNLYGSKLGIFSTISNTGKTEMIAVAYIAGDEDTHKFKWIFEMFLKYFRVPAVILTDSCPKIEGAAVETFSGIKHFLCIWHIFKNFSFHLCWMCTKIDWHNISKLFWKMARETDLRSVDTFNDDFEFVLKSLLSASEKLKCADRDPARYKKAFVWLNDYLKPKATKWAYRFTAGYFSVGAHSTQRGEACNATIKNCLQISNFNLTNLQTYLDNKCADIKLNAEIESERHIKSFINSSKAQGPILEFLEPKITPYAFKKVQEQYAQKDFYGFEEIIVDGKLTGWRVRRISTAVMVDIDHFVDGEFYGTLNSELGLHSSSSPTDRILDVTGSCSCRLLVFWGIACRHFLCVLDSLMKTNNPLADVLIHKCMHSNKFWAAESQDFARSSDSVILSSKSQNPTRMAYNQDTMQGHMNYLLSACKNNSTLTRICTDRLKALALEICMVNANRKGDEFQTSSEFIGVGNMPVQNTANLAGRKPRSGNNSKALGKVTADTDFSLLTSKELVQVLVANGLKQSGNKAELLSRVQSIKRNDFKSPSIDNNIHITDDNNNRTPYAEKRTSTKEILDEFTPFGGPMPPLEFDISNNSNNSSSNSDVNSSKNSNGPNATPVALIPAKRSYDSVRKRLTSSKVDVVAEITSAGQNTIFI